MRAWQVARHGAPAEVLVLGDRDRPEPGPGRLRVRVVAAGIGLPDALMCTAGYAFSPPVPFVPGQEVCGIVEAVGPDTSIAIGTRVMGVTDFFDGHGGLADACLMGEATAFRVPDDMDDVIAAGFRIGYSTAWIGLVRRGALRSDETVLVLGAAGGSGVAAIEVAHALGARVIAVVSDAEKAALVRRMGADEVVDRTMEPVADRVRELTGGRGVDVVYDPVGGDAASVAMRALASWGRFLAVGFAGGRWAVPDTAAMVRGNWSFIGVYAGAIGRADNEADHERLLELVGSGRLRPQCTEVAFDDGASVVQRIAEGRAVGKHVVRVSER